MQILDKGTTIIMGVTVLVFALLVVIGVSITRPVAPALAFWPGTDIPCLQQTDSIMQTIESSVHILVNDQPEVLDAIGISEECVASIHSIGADNAVTVQSTDATRTYTLRDVFLVMGKDMSRDGLELEVLVDDEPSAEPQNVLLENGQTIVLSYTGSSTAPAMETPTPDALQGSEPTQLELTPLPSEE